MLTKEDMMKIKEMVLVGMFAALLAIISPLQIIVPFSPVPITLQVIGITLAATILGSRLGTLSVVMYILLGIVGLPVFAGFTSGIPKLIGPTGGFITGFILSAFIMGKLIELKKDVHIFYMFFINIIGLIIVYSIGAIQLSIVYTHSISKALAAGVIPFIIPDLIKLVFCSIVTIQVRKVLEKSGYLMGNKSLKANPKDHA